MTLQDQVISLESAKRLKELGVAQKSIFYWELFLKTKPTLVFVPRGMIIEAGDNEYVSAFTCSELGELLPKTIKAIKGINYPKHILREEDKEIVEWHLESRNGGL